MQSANPLNKRLMLTNPEPDQDVEELNDDEIYDAIRHLEPDPRRASEQSNDATTTKKNKDNGAVIGVCLYVAVLG